MKNCFFKSGTISDNKVYSINRVPAVTTLDDGELLAVWMVMDGPTSRIVGSISSDNGETWSSLKTIVKSEAEGTRVCDPCLLVTPSGKVILFYIIWRSFQDSRIALKESIDNARSWKPAIEIDTGHKYNDLNRNGIVLSDNTTLIQGFSWEKRGPTLVKVQ